MTPNQTQFRPNSYLALIAVEGREYSPEERRELHDIASLIRIRNLAGINKIKILYQEGKKKFDFGEGIRYHIANTNTLYCEQHHGPIVEGPRSFRDIDDLLRDPTQNFEPEKATIILADAQSIARALSSFGLNQQPNVKGHQLIAEVTKEARPQQGYYVEWPHRFGNYELKPFKFPQK